MFEIREVNAEIDGVSSEQMDAAGASRADRLNVGFASLDAIQRIRLLREQVPGRLVFTTSFGLEDQALIHLIASADVDVQVVTLDTGRLFPQTYDVWAATEERYGMRIRAIQPDAQAVEDFISDYGINGFYASKAAREACCAVRKRAPLSRGLKGAAAWITGLRAEQSEHRRGMRFVSQETAPSLLKANPLLDWSRDQVVGLVTAERVPSNPLHQRGFLSIGCAPCTRAVAPGEPERSGRWWWEESGNAECGLHVTADGRLVRRTS